MNSERIYIYSRGIESDPAQWRGAFPLIRIEYSFGDPNATAEEDEIISILESFAYDSAEHNLIIEIYGSLAHYCRFLNA